MTSLSAETASHGGRKQLSTSGFHPEVYTGAHSNMAANLEQIFQDFILKKIREIEHQKEEKP